MISTIILIYFYILLASGGTSGWRSQKDSMEPLLKPNECAWPHAFITVTISTAHYSFEGSINQRLPVP